MKSLLAKLFKENELDNEELLFLLDNLSLDYERILSDYALITRKEIYGDKVFLRALLEISNHCNKTCKYCGLRGENASTDRYRLSREEILESCKDGYKHGFRTFVLQSGEDSYFTDDILEEIIKEIKSQCPGVAITLSIGEKSRYSYLKYFKAGVDRYLLRHESASKTLYEELHPSMSVENRRRCLWQLKDIGYQVGAGFIVGLPGQDNKVLVEDLMFLKKLKPHMVGIGPLIVHPDTPLRNCSNGTMEKTLVCLALIRLLLPEVLLPSTTALNVLDPLGLGKALQVGANVVMPNITPLDARKKYELYKGKDYSRDINGDLMKETIERIEAAGFEVDMGRGDHPDFYI
ncbi:MAG: [FeFe] hydrogenase H-cluster radical SAM maturase HydE [Clostridia bacterium]|nr:[FeFe] hydrogenase H-cluster radical SAM maturase HydE [Clostridia bacterium]MDD4048182.1 [FeFe] hydrogenase H-cluster radical SAM maturase HydE [Clostridia bacterium]